MSEHKEASTGCVIKTAELFTFINQRRQSEGKAPIEHSSMVTRCTLRFNVDKQRGIDFSQPQVVIDAADLKVLEQVINAQFELYLSDDLKRLCQNQAKATPKQRPATPLPPAASPAAPQEEGKGLMSRIKGMFGGD